MEDKAILLKIQTTLDFSENWIGSDNFNFHFKTNSRDFWLNNIDIWDDILKSVIKENLEDYLRSNQIQGVSIEVEITDHLEGSLKIIANIFLKIDPNLVGSISGLVVQNITKIFYPEIADDSSELIKEFTSWFVEVGISLIQKRLKEKLNKKGKELLPYNANYPSPEDIIEVSEIKIIS